MDNNSHNTPIIQPHKQAVDYFENRGENTGFITRLVCIGIFTSFPILQILAYILHTIVTVTGQIMMW